MVDTIVTEIRTGSIKADYKGFNSLSVLGQELLAHNGKDIHIDFERLYWVDAHLSAPLMTVINKSRRQGNNVTLIRLRSEVKKVLSKNNTLVIKEPDKYGTTIPLCFFNLSEGVNFANYTKKHLSRNEMPKMSPGLKSKFFEGLDELFVNCVIHSKSQIKVTASGQYYPNLDKIAFVISDGGIGIEESLLGAGKIFDEPQLAIDWAMQMSNTARSGDVPGGLGLSILKEFVKINGGRLVVCSHKGYWEMNGEGVVMRPMRTSFSGTVVTMEILTSDPKSYDIVTSINPHALW